jgi:hypothetical protein
VVNASSVPLSGSAVGKKSLLNTSAAAEEYRKKSYHSMVVPIRLAETMRGRDLGGVTGREFTGSPRFVGRVSLKR